ncbi:MAG: TVP38/TMEM64 family protein [Planctomycetaceae bacterium]|nr:TVP38/TMEM64 family protein [Planctomycetaceae bacterium]
MLALYWTFRDWLTLAALAEREAELRAYQQEHWLLLYAAAFALYVAVAAFSIPAATVLTLVIGWLFGFRWGLLLVSFASTAGATAAFLMSRYLLRDYVATRFREWVPRVTTALERDGPLYLFAMRLTPAVPFFVVNLVMGLTGLRTRTFWWVSQLGMLPATAIFVYAGSTVPNLQHLAERGPQAIITWPLATAFVLLGVFPFVARWVMKRWTMDDGR